MKGDTNFVRLYFLYEERGFNEGVGGEFNKTMNTNIIKNTHITIYLFSSILNFMILKSKR